MANKFPRSSLKKSASKVEGWPSYLRTSSSAQVVARSVSVTRVQKKKAA